jgi:hypothetical protein
MSATLSRGLRSEIERRFCESVGTDSRDSCSRDRRRDRPGRDLRNFFFVAQNGGARVDFAPRARRRKRCQGGLRGSAHDLFDSEEAPILQALLRLLRYRSQVARRARRVRAAIAAHERATKR